MKNVVILSILFFAMPLAAQDSITLLECHRQATEQAPRLADRAYLREIGELQVDQANSKWFPTLELNGKLSYQSDVVTIALTDPSIPVDFPKVPQDQYGLNLDLRQTLYDGGIIKTRKQFEEAKVAADLQQLEVDLHALKSRVNQFYFAILMLEENSKNLGIHMDNLRSRREAMTSAVEAGTILEAELKVLDVEVLRVKQSLVEISSRKKAYLDALNVLCGTSYSEEDSLAVPEFSAYPDEQFSRPEYTLFDLKEATMETGKELAGKKRMPVVFAFGQTGYGKPGYNMMSGSWDFYYMVGAGLKWNILDWNSSNREKQVIENQQKMLRNQRATFQKEVESLLVQEEARMEQYKNSMKLEEQVLELQIDISENAAAKLSNGTITATEYITELNKESLSRINLATQDILLRQSIANYLTIKGNL